MPDEATAAEPQQERAFTHSRSDPTEELVKLSERHLRLQDAHDRLKFNIRRRVQNKLLKQNTTAANTQNFAETAMGTIAGWITAQTFYYGIIEAVGQSSLEMKWASMIARLIYAAFASIVVPLIDWKLRETSAPERVRVQWLADQIRLVRRCLPMFYAWAWRDVVSTALKLNDEAFWPELLATVIITSILIIVQMTPVYHRAKKAVTENENGPGDTPAARMVVNLGNLGLAVGFAWNQVASWAPRQAMKHVEAPMFVFMIQFIYFLLITALITFINSRWNKAAAAIERRILRRRKKAASDEHSSDRKSDHTIGLECQRTKDIAVEMITDIVEDAEAAVGVDPSPMATTEAKSRTSFAPSADLSAGELVVQMVDDIVDDMRDASLNVTLSALHFVYAWAQLDTLNALFFTYLLGCDGPNDCEYRYNFFFALTVTVVFARISGMLKLEHRHSAWGRASMALTTKACSLNTGWAWAKFSFTAIKSAMGDDVSHPVWIYLICTAFAWICISALHRRFEVERRAWDRHCKEEAQAYELSLS